MPPRSLQPVNQSNDAQAFERFTNSLAGFFDDPIVQCQIAWGPLNSTVRRLRIEVVDRRRKRYPPTSFRNNAGVSPGRWLVMVYFSDGEYGAAITPAVSWVTGRSLGTIGSTVHIGLTNSAGVLDIDVDKALTGEVWVHHSAPALFRSNGINWTTGGGGTSHAGDPPVANQAPTNTTKIGEG